MPVGDSNPTLPHRFLPHLRSALDRALPADVRKAGELDLHRGRLIVASAVLGPATSALSAALIGVAGTGELVALLASAACMLTALPLLWWTRGVDWPAHSTTAGLFVYGVLSLASSGGSLPFPAALFPIAALTAGLLCTRRAAYGWLAAHFVAIPAAVLVSPNAPLATPVDREAIFAGLLFSPPVLLSVLLYRDLFERVLAERTAMAREARTAADRQIRLAAQLRSSELQNGLGRMAGGVAHEFNNILAAIGGSAELIALSGAVSTRERALAGRIGEAVDRAASLVRQLLDFSGRGRRRLEPLGLGSRLERAERLLRATLSKQIALDVRVRTDACVLADPVQVEQLIVHLVQNAERAYGGKPGEVWVEADALPFGAPATTVPPEPLPARPYAVLRVIDRGRGIDPEHAERIFEPFYSGFEGGRGLGLSAALGIVRSHGGGIAVASATGAGTTVSVYLPQCEPDAEAETAASAEPPSAQGALTLAGRAVLVVDDEEAIRAVLAEYLRDEGATVIEADDGASALALVSRGAHVDAAFVDVSMPRLDGLGLLEALRSAGREFPVVLMTGHGALDLTRFDAGSHVALLRKPFPLSAVSGALAQAARGGRIAASL